MKHPVLVGTVTAGLEGGECLVLLTFEIQHLGTVCISRLPVHDGSVKKE